ISFETLWGYSPLNIHVALGIAVLPFIAWHVRKRWKTNRAGAPALSRRAALRLAGLGAVSLVGWQGALQAANLLTLPGTRRETGSKFAAAFSSNAYPAEIWLFDPVPSIDPDQWRLGGSLNLNLDDLLHAYPRKQVQAVLDCTSGWWTEQIWSGVPVTAV